MVGRAPQINLLPLSPFCYLKCSVKVRKFLLYEFATKRAKPYCVYKIGYILHIFLIENSFINVDKMFVKVRKYEHIDQI